MVKNVKFNSNIEVILINRTPYMDMCSEDCFNGQTRNLRLSYFHTKFLLKKYIDIWYYNTIK